MTMKAALKIAEKFVVENTPGILTGLGVAGSVTAVFLTGRAAYRVGMDASTQYHEAVKENEPLPEHLLEPKHLVRTYWKEFVPAASVGVVTIASIIAANQVGARRTAAIAAAFKLSEQLTEEYKDKVLSTLGVQKEEKMRSELAAEKMEKNPPPQGMLIVAGSDVLFFDELSGRYFHNQVENVRKAVNEINHKVNNFFCASLTEFYELIGLSGTPYSDGVGWNSDELLEVQFSATMYEDKPAIMLGYNHEPVAKYDRCQ